MMKQTAVPVLLGAALLVGATACSDDDGVTTPDLEAPVLRSVVPQGGATGVDPNTDVVLEFDHPLMPGMDEYVDLHEGDVTGPEVPGTWSMSDDAMRLTFSPDQPLTPNTDHTVHMGGAMMGQDGQHVDFESHGPGMGGHWATSGMMGGGGMGGPMGGQQGYHMGDGWQHPDNGSYGMVFTFTTGS